MRRPPLQTEVAAPHLEANTDPRPWISGDPSRASMLRFSPWTIARTALPLSDLVNEPIFDGRHETALGTLGLVALLGYPGRVFDNDPRFELVFALRTLDDNFHSRHAFPPTPPPSARNEAARDDLVDKPGGRCGGMLANPMNGGPAKVLFMSGSFVSREGGP